jgi:hypothetical protein
MRGRVLNLIFASVLQVTDEDGVELTRQTAIRVGVNYFLKDVVAASNSECQRIMASVDEGRQSDLSDIAARRPSDEKHLKRSRFGCEGLVRLPSIATPQSGQRCPATNVQHAVRHRSAIRVTSEKDQIS